MKRLLHVLTVPASLRFLRGQPAFMRERGYETHVCCSPGPMLDRFVAEHAAPAAVVAHPLPFARRVTPLEDLKQLRRLTALIRALRPDVVHAQTPKAGLLGTLAGRAARAPRVLYHMRGLPYLGAKGPLKPVLWATERVACAGAHVVLCHSRSLRDDAARLRLLDPREAVVIGPGGNGVDPTRFDPYGPAAAAGQRLREELQIPAGAPVVGFVGRLVRDKGIVELVRAWASLRRRFEDAHLVVVGPFEPRDPVPEDTADELRAAPRTHLCGERSDVAAFYALMDLLVLPSYREGFPNVPIEAAAMEVPTVATRIGGCVDAVVDSVTGALVPPRDAASLERAIARYLEDPALRRRHGEAARARALSELSPERIWEGLADLYDGREGGRG